MCYGYYVYAGGFPRWGPPPGIGGPMRVNRAYHPYGRMWHMPYYQPPAGFADSRVSPFIPPITPEQEIGFLRDQAQVLKEQLDQIDARIKELDKENN